MSELHCLVAWWILQLWTYVSLRLERSTSGNLCLCPLAASSAALRLITVSCIKLSVEEIANATRLKPPLVGLLRAVDLHEDTITELRVREIKNRGLFVALDSTEEGFTVMCKQASGIDTDDGGVVEAVSLTSVSGRRSTKIGNKPCSPARPKNVLTE